MEVLTKEEIRVWFEEKKEENYSHMMIVCDRFDYDNYPVFVKKDRDDVNKKIWEYDGRNMQKVMEVYSYKLPIESQLEENRAWNI